MRVASKVSSHCSGDHYVPNLELTRTPPTVVLPTSQWWDGTTLKYIYTYEFLRVGSFSYILALNFKTNSKNALIERYEFKHYRSIQKDHKNTFWVKAPYMNMEDPI